MFNMHEGSNQSTRMVLPSWSSRVPDGNDGDGSATVRLEGLASKRSFIDARTKDESTLRLFSKEGLELKVRTVGINFTPAFTFGVDSFGVPPDCC